VLPPFTSGVGAAADTALTLVEFTGQDPDLQPTRGPHKRWQRSLQGLTCYSQRTIGPCLPSIPSRGGNGGLPARPTRGGLRHFMQTSAVGESAEIRTAALPPGDLVVGDWLVEPDLDRVTREGVAIHLRPKLMDVLVYLAQNAGRTVPHEELRARIWPGQRFIAASVLPRCIAELRQTLGDRAACSTLIQTIPKRGYRLIAAVRQPANAVAEHGARVMRPSLRRSATSPAEPTRVRLLPTPEARSAMESTSLPASHGAPVAGWLRRVQLKAMRVWRSLRSRVK
jgi:DNA-binding winged helix-turn-helix (wHTH) protein